jgi:hypothetical protein
MVGRRQVGVAEGHRQGGVSQQLLQLGQGHSPHHGMGREGVAEVVEREVLDLRPPERQLERGTDPVLILYRVPRSCPQVEGVRKPPRPRRIGNPARQ